jgi:hypothetical protein
MATKKQPVSKKELSANKAIVVIIAIGLLIVIATGLVMSFVVPRMVQNTKVIVKKVAAKSAVDTKLDNAKKLVDAYGQLGNKTQLIMDSLPTKADFAQTIVILEGIANTDGVKLKSALPPDTTVATADTSSAPTSATGPASYETTTFTTVLEGPYGKLLPAIKDIEKSSRPLKVVGVDIQGTGGIVSATVKVETYFQKEANISDGTEQVK